MTKQLKRFEKIIEWKNEEKESRIGPIIALSALTLFFTFCLIYSARFLHNIYLTNLTALAFSGVIMLSSSMIILLVIIIISISMQRKVYYQEVK